MKKVTKVLAIVVAVSLLSSVSVSSHATDNPFIDTFESALYGGLAGALVGAALLVFTENPEDHLNYMAYGGAGGIIAGTLYGVAKTSKSLVEYDNGTLKYAIPTVIPEIRQNQSKGTSSVVLNAQLIRGTF